LMNVGNNQWIMCQKHISKISLKRAQSEFSV